MQPSFSKGNHFRGESIFYDWSSTRDVSVVFVNALNAKANIYPRQAEDLVKY